MRGFRESTRWAALVFVGAGAWLVSVACGSGSHGSPLGDGAVLTSGDDPSGGGGTSAGSGSSAAGSVGATPASDGDRFLTDYANAVCAMYRPCCEAEALGFNAAGCSDWFARVTAAYLPDRFVPEAGAACLAAVAEARARDPQRCANVAVFDDASLRTLCEQAFVAPARAGAALGGACTLAGDCAAADGEQIICYGRMCVLQHRGSAGDGPCYAGGNVEVAQEMFSCEATEGLYCDRTANACALRVAAGERCASAAACDETALCSGGMCRALPATGEPCLNGIPGAGGYCRVGSCDATSLTCGPGAAEGEACSDTRKCDSGVCLSGTCASSDWQRNLNCTGRAAQ